MRQMLMIATIIGTVGAMLASSASASIMIAPNDDTFIAENAKNTPQDAPGVAAAGLFMKNQSSGGLRRAVFIEYTIPNVTATEATFNATYFRSQTAGSGGAFTMQVAGSTTPADFDETTLTWNIANAPGGINNVDTYTYSPLGTVNLPGGNGTGTSSQQQDVVPNVQISIDILAYFNAHKGETVTFKLTSLAGSTNSTAGGSLQDREQSRVMTSTDVAGQIPAAPFIAYVPEPATALLLIAGLPLLRRRRA